MEDPNKNFKQCIHTTPDSSNEEMQETMNTHEKTQMKTYKKTLMMTQAQMSQVNELFQTL